MYRRGSLNYLLIVLSLVAGILLAGCQAAEPTAEAPTETSPPPTEEEAPAATSPPATEEAPTATSPPAPEEARTLVVGVSTDASALDPQIHNSLNSRIVYSNIFDVLLGRDVEGNFKSSLVVSWEAVEDTTWELKLRDDVVFHNGDPFTAADVKYWFDRMLDPETESFFRSRFELVSGVEQVDDYTVHVNTKAPFPILPSRLAEVYPVPHEYFEEVGPEYFNEHPIGTGPYKFVEWAKDDQITLEANEDYWGEVPAIEEVVFRIVPEPSTRVSELLSEGVHIAQQVPVNLADRIEETEGTSLAHLPTDRVVFFFLDMTDPSLPTHDVRVRKAMNYAVDRELIAEEVLGGYARPLGQRISTYDFGFDPSIEPYPYDPAMARDLLAEAGYADGFDLTCWSTTGHYLMDDEIMAAVAAQLAEVGINLDVEYLEFSAYLEKMNSNNLSPMTFAAFGTGTFDAYQMLAYTHSDDVLGYLDDPAYDAVLEEAGSTVDSDERLELYRQLLQREHDEAFFVTMFQYEGLWGVSNDINFSPRPDELILVKDITWR